VHFENIRKQRKRRRGPIYFGPGLGPALRGIGEFNGVFASRFIRAGA
jgi:hypothetical protein